MEGLIAESGSRSAPREGRRAASGPHEYRATGSASVRPSGDPKSAA